MTNQALAYVYSGAWVAECPTECGNVQTVSRDETSLYRCVYCQQISTTSWPPEAEMMGIMEVLGCRPNPGNRNWYPEGHPVAVKFSVPHGQSVQDLLDENAEHGIF